MRILVIADQPIADMVDDRVAPFHFPNPEKPVAPVQYVSREEAMDSMLDKLEQHLIGNEMKGTVADYLRLIQVRREIADGQPREIEIEWVNSLGGEEFGGE